MNFLLNMNTPRELGRRLASEGHEYRHLSDIGMARSSDSDVVEEARRSGEVIITHDLDYGRLLAFSGEATPSVIVFRLRNTNTGNLFAQLINIWQEIEWPLHEGAIVVIEDATLRIRRLPVIRE